MTNQDLSRRKPRIALMGEFSAGKSTLSNLLLGSRPLPEKVTATRLSPVWMAAGSRPPYRIDVDGTEELVSIEHLEEIPVEDTRVIRLFFESDILDVCDLIDFPGISDPNMSTDVVERMLDEVDAVLWCTHATQAWRQSEAAFWAGLFPISLLQALQAGEDYEKWDSSGAGAFSDHLIEMVQELTLAVAGQQKSLYALGDDAPAAVSAEDGALLLTDPVVNGRDPEAAPVVPRRVVAKSSAGRGTVHKIRMSSDGTEGADDDNLTNNTQIAS